MLFSFFLLQTDQSSISIDLRTPTEVENLVNLVEELKRATPSDAAELGEGDRRRCDASGGSR